MIEETTDYRKKKSFGETLIDTGFSLISAFYYIAILGAFAFSGILLVKLFPEYLYLIVAFFKISYIILLIVLGLLIAGIIIFLIEIMVKVSEKTKARREEAEEFRFSLMERLNDIEDKLQRRKNR